MQDDIGWLEELIARGESAQLEFKATLGYRAEGEARTTLRDKCLQAVAGLMNADGGILLIGVQDDRSVLGVEGDIDVLGSRDAFERTLRDALADHLGGEVAAAVGVSFTPHPNGTVAVVECGRHPHPVFVTRERHSSEFWVRAGPTTRKLDSRELTNYLETRFESKTPEKRAPLLAPDTSEAQPRVLYLQWLIPAEGQARESLRGRKLFDLLRRELSQEIRLAHHVAEDPGINPLDPDFGDLILAAEEVAADPPDVVFLEGGLFGGPGDWRLPRDLAFQWVRSGGVLIVADVGRNQCVGSPAEYRESLHALCCVEPDVEGDTPFAGNVAYLIDETSHTRGVSSILVHPDQMGVSHWLRPVYEGIDAVLVSGAVRLRVLEPGTVSVLATGNEGSTRVLRADLPARDSNWSPFASVTQGGQGYAVIIAASVTADRLLEQSPDNGRWLLNIARFLHSEVLTDRSRRTAGREKPDEDDHLNVLSD